MSIKNGKWAAEVEREEREREELDLALWGRPEEGRLLGGLCCKSESLVRCEPILVPGHIGTKNLYAACAVVLDRRTKRTDRSP
jgi:hypothetical protein